MQPGANAMLSASTDIRTAPASIRPRASRHDIRASLRDHERAGYAQGRAAAAPDPALGRVPVCRSLERQGTEHPASTSMTSSCAHFCKSCPTTPTCRSTACRGTMETPLTVVMPKGDGPHHILVLFADILAPASAFSPAPTVATPASLASAASAPSSSAPCSTTGPSFMRTSSETSASAPHRRGPRTARLLIAGARRRPHRDGHRDPASLLRVAMAIAFLAHARRAHDAHHEVCARVPRSRAWQH